MFGYKILDKVINDEIKRLICKLIVILICSFFFFFSFKWIWSVALEREFNHAFSGRDINETFGNYKFKGHIFSIV